VGAEAAWAREMLETLEVDPERMRSNLEAAGDLVMAEGVATALAAHIGRGHAHELTEGAARRAAEEGRSLRDVLSELPDASEHLGPESLDAALDPYAYLGAASQLVERALAAHRKTLDHQEPT
jgi:3-carboxy-cis,cis-muconate cycloisomerase